MKMRSFVFAAAAAVAAGTSAKAEVSARVWMLDHANPNTDELSELRVENPDAYALVKALLTKRSLGLLDPKHPTASFSKPAPEDEGSHPVGAAVYAKFATTDKERQALANAEPAYDTSTVESVEEVVTPAPSSGSHDWLSWKPADSAASDDAMVQNVLGSVAGLVGKKIPAPSAPKVSSGLEADEASILSADDAPAAPKPVVQEEPAPVEKNFLAKAPEPPAPPAPKPQGNSYLDGLDLTVDTKPDTPAPAVQAVAVETPAAPVAAAAATSSLTGGKSALDSFSFSDSEDTTTTAAPKVQTPAPKSSALGSWLGMVQPHVQKAAVPATTAVPSDANPYLTDLQ